MTDVLTLSAGFPEIQFDVGDGVVHEGGTDGAIWVLVDGACAVRKGGILVNSVTHPGSMIGEMSVLLGVGHSATVEAVAPSRLRLIADGRTWLESDPSIAMSVAVGLAERLSFLTTYLADLQHQYGDAPGLSMVSDVLRKLSQRRGPVSTAGSARDPNPDY